MINEEREWKAKVAHILKNGMIIKEAVDKHPFPDLISNKQYGKIKDPIIFEKPKFSVGDVIKIKLKYINPEERERYKNIQVIKDGFLKWTSVVYQVSGNGFFTKNIDQNRFLRIFSYQYRTHITDDVYLNNDLRDNNNPFEVGDIVLITIMKE